MINPPSTTVTPSHILKEPIHIANTEHIGTVSIDPSPTIKIVRWADTPTYRIIRHARDDTFGVDIMRCYKIEGNPLYNTYIRTFPYLNIDNAIELIGLESPIANQLESVETSLNTWRVHRSMIKNINFRDTSLFVAGEDTILYDSSTASSLIYVPNYRSINTFQFSEMNKNVVTSFDGLVQLDAISRIQFFGENKPTVTAQEITPLLSGTFEPRRDPDPANLIEYSHILIKPAPLDFWKGNDTIAEIYAFNEDRENGIKNMLDIQAASMKSTTLGSGQLDLYFERYEGEVHELQTPTFKASLVGKLKIASSTYYDYASGHTKIGFAPHSTIGEIIPYGYRGDYTREISIDFNKVFTKMKIAFTTTIGQPILGASNGEVRLNVSSDSEPQDVPQQFFTPEDIKLIRTHKIDLIGLNRLAQDAT